MENIGRTRRDCIAMGAKGDEALTTVRQPVNHKKDTTKATLQ